LIHNLTFAGAIHLTLAMLCIAVGLIQFLCPKRGAGHRARGYFYVYAMLVADGTAMLLYRFSGSFNLFHVAAIINLTCIVLAVVPLLRSPRPANWRLTPLLLHLLVLRVADISGNDTNRTAACAADDARTDRADALVLSMVVMTIAYVLIGKHRPPAEAPSASTRLAEQGGVPS
jgi:uncharacterized membrane protein